MADEFDEWGDEFPPEEVLREPSASAPLTPDRATIRAHLEKLFARARVEYTPDAMCEIAWSTKDLMAVPSANRFVITPEGLDRAADLALEKNLTGLNVYVCVNPQKPGCPNTGRGNHTYVEIAFYNFSDSDGPDARQRMRDAPFPCTFNVCSGRTPHPRLHPYFEHEAPTRNMTSWRETQIGVGTLMSGDAIWDAGRLMRVAGCINYPAPIKVPRGYVPEMVTLRLDYGDGERSPVPSEELHLAFAPKSNGEDHTANGHYDEDLYGTFGVLNVARLLKRIRAGQGGWHNDVNTLVRHLIHHCTEDSIILALAPSITLKGFKVEQTERELRQSIGGWRTKTGFTNDETIKEEGEDFDRDAKFGGRGKLTRKRAMDIDPTKVEDLDCLLDQVLYRDYLSLLVAPGGTGKTALFASTGIHLAAARPWMGKPPYKRPLRMLVVSGEETYAGLERLIAATMLHHGITAEDIGERLDYISTLDNPIFIAESDGKQVRKRAGWHLLEEAIIDCKPDVVLLDPLVEYHAVEENATTQMKQVAAYIRELAYRYHCAFLIAHHTPKPPQAQADSFIGNPYAARGAVSLVNASRVSMTLFTLDETCATQIGISEPAERRRHIRLDGSKSNPSTLLDMTLFKIIGVRLPNGGRFGEGTMVPVVTFVPGIQELKAQAEAAEARASEYGRDALLIAVERAIPADGFVGQAKLIDMIHVGLGLKSTQLGQRLRYHVPFHPRNVEVTDGEDTWIVWKQKDGNGPKAPLRYRKTLKE